MTVPGEHRSKVLVVKPQSYQSVKNYSVYHECNCGAVTGHRSSLRIEEMSLAEAREQGLRPCRRCHDED